METPEVTTAEQVQNLALNSRAENESCCSCLNDASGQWDSLFDSTSKMYTALSKLHVETTNFNQVCSIDIALKDHSNTLSQAITSSASGLSEKISEIPEGSYQLAIASGVIGAIVAAFAAGVLNFLYWRHVNKENKKTHFSNCSLEHLCEFEKSAVSYWIQDKTVNNVIEMQLLEVKIQSQLQVLRSSLKALISQFNPSDKPDKEVVESFVNDIFDIATGGTFETSDKKSEKNVALKISKRCSLLKTKLLKHSQQTN